MIARWGNLLGGIGGYRSYRDLGNYHEHCSHRAGTAKLDRQSKQNVDREGVNYGAKLTWNKVSELTP